MKCKLSILICHLRKRQDFLHRLLDKFPNSDSPYFKDFEVRIDDREHISIGEKRNSLLQNANGEYVVFIDDDDLITENYFTNVFEGIAKGADCCSLRGLITDDGRHPRIFEHSIKYDRYATVQKEGRDFFERYPNHLNVIRADLAKQFRFPETNHGEDTDWATQLHNSGLLKTEHWIEDIIYIYEYRSKK